MISIIVPVYNAAKHLDKCIKSIIDQTYQNWELILINDGSSDRSGTICDAYACTDHRIKVVHQPNAGASRARNNGIKLAKGKFITFIDADDWIECNYLEKVKNLNPDNNTLIAYGISYDFTDSKQDFRFIPSADEILLHGVVCAKVWPTEIIRHNNIFFEEGLHLHEDHVFFYEALNYIERVIIIPHALYHYMHYGERSLSRRLQTSDQYFLAADLMLAYYPADNKCTNESIKSKCIQKFGLNQLIMGLFSALQNESRTKQRNAIEKVASYKPLFLKHYHANSLKGLLISKSIVSFPKFLQWIFFKCVVTVAGKRLTQAINIQ